MSLRHLTDIADFSRPRPPENFENRVFTPQTHQTFSARPFKGDNCRDAFSDSFGPRRLSDPGSPRCLTFADCRLQTADCRLQTADHTLRDHISMKYFKISTDISDCVIPEYSNLAIFIIPAVTRLAQSLEMFDHSVSSIVKLNFYHNCR